MKTLDEVIREVAKRRDLDNDIYHYLKEYREKHDDILRMEEALGYCMDNQPLTLDKGE